MNVKGYNFNSLSSLNIFKQKTTIAINTTIFLCSFVANSFAASRATHSRFFSTSTTFLSFSSYYLYKV